jgi:ribosomal RNA-processing protein 9
MHVFAAALKAASRLHASEVYPAVMQASGAGDGWIRMWGVEDGGNGHRVLQPVGNLPARGFVNGLAIAKSGRFVVAAMGQEPRLGRWVRDKAAKNGVLFHPLKYD